MNRHDDGFGRYHRCVLSMTGLGRRMASIVVGVSQRNIDLALVLTMLVAIILGMGMPSVAAYTAVIGNLLPLVSVCFKSFNTNGDFSAIRRASSMVSFISVSFSSCRCSNTDFPYTFVANRNLHNREPKSHYSFLGSQFGTKITFRHRATIMFSACFSSIQRHFDLHPPLWASISAANRSKALNS